MNQHIADLDASLAENGQDATLRRTYGTAPNVTLADVAVRIAISATATADVASGIKQTESNVIMSPTEIANAGWPGTVGGDPIPDVPRRLDRLIVDGRERSIELANPRTVGGELVRIELKVRG